jgi:hypothetical protein
MENSNTCANCIHWKAVKHITGGDSEDNKICSIANSGKSNGLMDAICFGEGIAGELITNKDFSCILHSELNTEKKENEAPLKIEYQSALGLDPHNYHINKDILVTIAISFEIEQKILEKYLLKEIKIQDLLELIEARK